MRALIASLALLAGACASVQAPPQYWRSQPRDFKNVFGPDARIGQR